MPQTTDIVINSAGYMIEPGTYKRLQDGMAEGRTERISITDFFGGQHRTIQLERDRFGDSLAIGPALGGQGVAPWPSSENIPITAIATTFPHRDAPIPNVIVRDRIWMAIGKNLYRGVLTTPGTGWGWTLQKTYANTITDMCIYASNGLLIAFGSAADIIFFNTLTNVESVLFATERGNQMAAYAGFAAWSDARTTSRPSNLRLVSGTGFDERALDHDPIALTTVGAELVVVTKQALYTYTGRVKEVTAPGGTGTVHEWIGELTPFFQQGVYAEQDDYKMLLGFGGRTIAWIANGVHELVPSGDRAGWRSTGLDGKHCFGGCVAAGYVFVSIESWSGNNEVWAYDGNGWWRILSQPMPAGATGTWVWPVHIGKGGWGHSVVIFTEGSTATQVLRLVPRTWIGFYEHSLPASAQFVTPLIDAGERDKPKAWRKVGATFAATERTGNLASLDPVTIYLDYSIDSGTTWVQVATATLTANTLANMNRELTASLSGVVSTFVLIRVRWAGVLDWTPVLVGVWAEYEVLANPARRRKWDFQIHASDQEIDRDGVLLTRTGRQLIAELWAAWETDTTLTFRDIDYDTAVTQRNVRIVGISEAVAQPADSAEWGDSVITLKLVEV